MGGRSLPHRSHSWFCILDAGAVRSSLPAKRELLARRKVRGRFLQRRLPPGRPTFPSRGSDDLNGGVRGPENLAPFGEPTEATGCAARYQNDAERGPSTRTAGRGTFCGCALADGFDVALASLVYRIRRARTHQQNHCGNASCLRRNLDLLVRHFPIENGQTVDPLAGRKYLLYDELPLRVRTMDFAKPTASFAVQLGRSITSPQEQEFLFQPATLSYQVNERAITIELKHEAGSDKFLLDRDFPFLLREWKAADGTQWKLKNGLKAPFATYNKPEDRERALKDPMLRHPD